MSFVFLLQQPSSDHIEFPISTKLHENGMSSHLTTLTQDENSLTHFVVSMVINKQIWQFYLENELHITSSAFWWSLWLFDFMCSHLLTFSPI
jgi:hypothetical protein